MKNNLIYKNLIMTTAVVLTTASPAFSAPSVPSELKVVAAKFLLAMAGVIVFSIVIALGLSLYNKFFVSKHLKDTRYVKDTLRTPTDKDEAIMSFINKNNRRG